MGILTSGAKADAYMPPAAATGRSGNLTVIGAVKGKNRDRFHGPGGDK